MSAAVIVDCQIERHPYMSAFATNSSCHVNAAFLASTEKKIQIKSDAIRLDSLLCVCLRFIVFSFSRLQFFSSVNY